jgi:outer membrane protein assembly factor BamB
MMTFRLIRVALLLLGLSAAVPVPAWAQITADVEQGKKLFEGMCARCHGIDGTGDEGPNLNRSSLTRAAGDEALRAVIRDGIPDRGMPRVRRLTDYKGEATYKPGEAFTGGGGRAINGDDAWGAVRALEATTGKMKWEFKLLTPPWTGLLSTAGGLVFGGTEEGNFFALDADTGQPLWDLQLGAAIKANPVSFGVDGKQLVAIAAGYSLFVFGLP